MQLFATFIIKRMFNELRGEFGPTDFLCQTLPRHIPPARGISAGGRTTLLPGQTPAEEFAMLVHEVAQLCGVGSYVV